MKRALSYILIAFAAIFNSCDDSLDPKTDPVDGYVLYCIINADTTFQTAYLSGTYDVSGTDPLENTTNPAISNAVVTINYKNSNYLFADSSVSRGDTSRYNDSFHFYYNNNLSIKSEHINDIAYPCTVKVALPNKDTLISIAESIPTGDLFFGNYIYSFPVDENVRFCEFSWSFASTKNSLSKYYFLPIFEINYSKVENGVATRKKMIIPNGTYYASDKEVLVYPKVTKTSAVSYNKQYVIDAFNKISEGDSKKGNYIIHNLTMNIILMDKNIAAYYSANNTYNDEFSVRIDAADYTNITGGYGLFGLYATKKKIVKLDKAYVELFGYTYEPKL